MGICQSQEATTNATNNNNNNARNEHGQTNIIDIVKAPLRSGATPFHHFQNVFTVPLDIPGAAYKPPVFPKTKEEVEFIRHSLKENFVFSGLDSDQLQTIIAAHEPHSVEKGVTIIKEGDKGDYFYILRKGKVKYVKGNKQVGPTATAGASFGELALLYSAPRAASVIALESCQLWRLDQITFRSILQSQNLNDATERIELLQNVSFLKNLDAQDVHKLAVAMKPKSFKRGELVMKKGGEGDVFYVMKEGRVKATDISVGHTSYEDVEVGPGDAFGERALLKEEPRAANVTALTDVKTLTIDKETFTSVLGELRGLILRANDKRKLGAIKVIKDSYLEPSDIVTLASFIEDQVYEKGHQIFTRGYPTEAALYLVREGKVELRDSYFGGTSQVIEAGGYFGEEQLLLDYETRSFGSTKLKSPWTATVLEECTVGVLTLEKCRLAMDTRLMGHGRKPSVGPVSERSIPRSELKKHAILGAGTFGQVWLVSYQPNKESKPSAYALKIQSKYDLIESHQAKGVVNEKKIMAQLNHPFLIRLVCSYQDPQRVYMLLGLVQGGELYSVMHTKRRDGLSENKAKFYAAGIIEGLTYMHNKSMVYRDLKPENVLIDAHGYPVIVDMGFAKRIRGKTYTFCGTPLYLPPEVIRNQGHDKGADHWSFAIMLYEMLAGETPFYKKGMDQVTLFKAIVKGQYEFPKRARMTPELRGLLEVMIVTNPSRRLGSLAAGSIGILRHPWFRSIEFSRLRRREIKAPWMPKIKDPLDASNFEDWSKMEDKDKVVDPPLPSKKQAIFADF